MKLGELYKKHYNKVMYIGIYEEGKKILPEFADELLETHSNFEVNDYQYVKDYDCLVVEFAK